MQVTQLETRIDCLDRIDIAAHKGDVICVESRGNPASGSSLELCPDFSGCLPDSFHQMLQVFTIPVRDEGAIRITFPQPIGFVPENLKGKVRRARL
jgi:hypothetical protein